MNIQKSFQFHGDSPLEMFKVFIVALLCAIASFSSMQAQKMYFFVEAGKDLDSNPLTNVVVFDGDVLYVYGASSFPNNRLRNNINYFEDLYSYEGYVNTNACEHFNSKFVLNRSKSDAKFDYYEEYKGGKKYEYSIMRISKDKSEMRKGASGTWRFVSIDKNEIPKWYDKGATYGSNGTSNNMVHSNQWNNYPGNNDNSSNNYYNNGGSSTNGHSNSQSARKFKCAYCNGSGRIERNDNAPASFGQSRANKKCNECGKIYDPTVFNHYHVQCGHCGGTGNAK